MKKRIPTFRIEEHHEAFLVWEFAVKKKIISPKDNILLHVDEHSDMSLPTTNDTIFSVLNNMESIKTFAYNQLGIASFIFPACYLNRFNSIYWIRNEHTKKSKAKTKIWVRSFNQEGKKILKGDVFDDSLPIDPDRKNFDYFKYTIEELPLKSKNVILDIDLDYFSCTGSPYLNKPISIEITMEEYEEYTKNKYYPLKLLYNSIMEPIEFEGKYYFIFNKMEYVYPSSTFVSNEIVKKRIENFTKQLKEKNIVPLMIDICRSRFSGYTDENQWRFIEDILLKELSNIYNIELIDNIRFTTNFNTPEYKVLK